MSKPHRIMPWIQAYEYEAFKKLSSEGCDLPPTYDEWLEISDDQAHAFIKSGIPIEKIVIHPKEFEEYCAACNINPDGVARAAFAVSKHCPKSEN